MDYIEYELDKLYAIEEFGNKVIAYMERSGLDPNDDDAWEQACMDYDDYCRGLHEDCELV